MPNIKIESMLEGVILTHGDWKLALDSYDTDMLLRKIERELYRNEDGFFEYIAEDDAVQVIAVSGTKRFAVLVDCLSWECARTELADLRGRLAIAIGENEEAKNA